MLLNILSTHFILFVIIFLQLYTERIYNTAIWYQPDSHLHLVPLKVFSSSCCLREFLFTTVNSGLLIKDRNLHLGYFKAAF